MNNRLKELRNRNGLSLENLQKELENKVDLKISSDSLSRYELFQRNPKPETWKKLADFYGVSVPYLQGAYSKEEIDEIILNKFKSNENKITKFNHLYDEKISQTNKEELTDILKILVEQTTILIATRITWISNVTTETRNKLVHNTFKKRKLMFEELEKKISSIQKEQQKIREIKLQAEGLLLFNSSRIKELQTIIVKLVNEYTNFSFNTKIETSFFKNYLTYSWLIKKPSLNATENDVIQAFVEACSSLGSNYYDNNRGIRDLLHFLKAQ